MILEGYEKKLYDKAKDITKQQYENIYNVMKEYDIYGNRPKLESRYGTDIVISFQFRFENDQGREYELYGDVDIDRDKIDIKTSSGPNVCDSKFIEVLNKLYKAITLEKGGDE